MRSAVSYMRVTGTVDLSITDTIPPPPPNPPALKQSGTTPALLRGI